ncbi:MAG: DUF2782 domain-containing protein [Gammaproteobacteria bacterium]|jgi:hypothetical protein
MNKMILVLLLACTTNCLAQQTAMEPLPKAAPPPSSGIDEELEPEVNIIRRDDAVVHEYSLNGQIYMIRVEPVRGYPYYLIDTDGDGSLDARRRQIDPELVVPNWMIYRW